MIGHLRFGNWRGLVGRNNLPIWHLWESDAADRAGVNDSLASRCCGSFKHMASPFHVGLIHGTVIAQPEMVTGRDMKAPIAAAHALLQQIAVAHVTFNAIEVRTNQ